MKNLKVRAKLMVSFGAVLLLFLMAIALGSVSVNIIQSKVKSFYEGPYSARIASNVAKLNFEIQQERLFRGIAAYDVDVRKNCFAESVQAGALLAEKIDLIEMQFADDPQIMTDLKDCYGRLATHRDKVIELVQLHKTPEATAYMEANIVPLEKKASALLDQIIEIESGKGDVMIADLNSTQGLALVILSALGIVGALLSLLLCARITKGLVSPLSELKRASNEMLHGNLKVSIGYHSRDEIGQVCDSMRDTVGRLDSYVSDIARVMGAMESGDLAVAPSADFQGDFVAVRDSMGHLITSLNSTLGQINGSAEQVSGGSEQVSNGAQALSQGATEQASAVEQLAAAINGISEQVKSTAGNAVEASKNAQLAGGEVDICNEQMKKLVAAMQEISASSHQIGNIIKTIEDIAFQTNILALNAAVEAARAGAAGKGFAVVADEVRSLAGKSAEAAKNTTELIEGSIQAVEKGSKIAGVTAGSLTKLVKSAEAVQTVVDKIAEAANRQADAVTQITGGIDQISSVVQTNSATAQQSAAASEELSGQARVLKGLVEGFRLSGSGTPGAPPSKRSIPGSSITYFEGDGKY